jgi:hypothetical protein
MSKGIVYFSDGRPEPKILKMCQKQLKESNLPIVNCSLVPMDFANKNIVLNMFRGYEAYFTQILTALENSHSEIIFWAEHDVLYPPSHFDFTPPTKDKFYYDQNWVKIDWPYTKGVSWDADQVSGLCCYRELALNWYKAKLKEYQNAPIKTEDKNRSLGNKQWDRKFEPGSGTEQTESWRSPEPYVDIRQSSAVTKNKWSIADFRDKRTAKNFREVTCPEWAKGQVCP